MPVDVGTLTQHLQHAFSLEVILANMINSRKGNTAQHCTACR